MCPTTYQPFANALYRTTTLSVLFFLPLHCYSNTTSLDVLFASLWDHYYLLIVFSVLLIVVLHLVLSLLHRMERNVMREERNEFQQQLLTAEAGLRQYAHHLQTVREEERTCISRELHDHLGQLLIALRIHMFRLATKTTAIELPILQEIFVETQQVIVELDSVIQSVRHISMGMRTTELDDVGLLSAIERHAQSFETRTNIPCQYISDIESIRMDKCHEIGVYRIVQESLTNIVRHAQATQIVISVTKDRNYYILTVTDNGVGINDNQLKRSASLGLQSMHERAALFGGKISIIGCLCKGTSIVLQIPLVAEQHKS